MTATASVSSWIAIAPSVATVIRNISSKTRPRTMLRTAAATTGHPTRR